jgi:hypothetical protein
LARSLYKEVYVQHSCHADLRRIRVQWPSKRIEIALLKRAVSHRVTRRDSRFVAEKIRWSTALSVEHNQLDAP